MFLFGHPRATSVFSKLQGLQYYFTDNFRCNLTCYECKNFSDSSLITFLSPKILGFSLPTKNNSTWVVNCEKLKFKNFIRWASKIIHEWNGHLDVFSRPQVIENSRQYLLLRSDILKKTVVGFPLFSLFKTNFIFPCKHLVLNANRY